MDLANLSPNNLPQYTRRSIAIVVAFLGIGAYTQNGPAPELPPTVNAEPPAATTSTAEPAATLTGTQVKAALDNLDTTTPEQEPTPSAIVAADDAGLPIAIPADAPSDVAEMPEAIELLVGADTSAQIAKVAEIAETSETEIKVATKVVEPAIETPAIADDTAPVTEVVEAVTKTNRVAEVADAAVQTEEVAKAVVTAEVVEAPTELEVQVEVEPETITPTEVVEAVVAEKVPANVVETAPVIESAPTEVTEPAVEVSAATIDVATKAVNDVVAVETGEAAETAIDAIVEAETAAQTATTAKVIGAVAAAATLNSVAPASPNNKTDTSTDTNLATGVASEVASEDRAEVETSPAATLSPAEKPAEKPAGVSAEAKIAEPAGTQPTAVKAEVADTPATDASVADTDTGVKAVAPVVAAAAPAVVRIPQSAPTVGATTVVPTAASIDVTPEAVAELVGNYPGKLLMVVFWSTASETEAQSFGWLNEMHQRYANRGLQIIGVNQDTTARTGEAYAVKHGAKFEITHDRSGALRKALWVGPLPATYLLNDAGELLGSHAGFNDDVRGSYEDEIRRLLKTLP